MGYPSGQDKDALFEKVVSSRMEVGGVNPMVCDFVTDDSVELPRLLPLVYCMNLAKNVGFKVFEANSCF